MANFTAVFDACVLYPAPLRDFLMWLALTDLFKARWTDQIHDEWIRNVLKNRSDLTFAQLTRTKNLMNQNVRDCLVMGYEDLVNELELPDANDRHVLAAAIYCNAEVIVTFNLQDFPSHTLAVYGIEAQHPDEFIMQLIDVNPSAVCRAAASQRKTLKKPSRSSEEYLETLLRQGLTQTTTKLWELRDGI